MTDTTGGPQFYSAIQAKAMAAVQDTFKSTLYPVQYPAQGDFTWNWQNPNQVFNDSTYQYINALVSPGEVPGTVALSPGGGFANAWVTVILDFRSFGPAPQRVTGDAGVGGEVRRVEVTPEW